MLQLLHMNSKPKLTFCGGAGSVTGANFLLETHGKRILIDCGLEQGTMEHEKKNYNDFTYTAGEIDLLIITHAHIDHIGRVPKLVRDGYTGPIISTIPTKKIAQVSLEDAVGLMANEAERYGMNPLYQAVDVDKAMSMWKGVSYHSKQVITEGLEFKLYDAGHILGSAQIMFFIDDKKVLFTGDLGNSPSPLLRDTEVPDEMPDYILTESVYGDRNHEERDERVQKLEDAYEDVAKRGGTLVIPAFSIDRTQELLFELNDMIENGRVPVIPVFVDSPMGIAVTKIYEESIEFLNDDVREKSKTDNVFEFKNLKFSYTSEDSKSINRLPAPKVILAGSGMSTGGRVLHHEKLYADDPKNMILLVGYQTPGSLGRAIQDKHKTLHIFGEEIPLRAEVRSISGFSGHKDSDHLQEYLSSIKDNVKTVFVAMGETGSSTFLAQRLRDYHGMNAIVPEEGETIVLE